MGPAPPLPTPRWDVGKIEVRMLRLPLQSKTLAVFFLQAGPTRRGPSANPLADSDVTLHTQPMTWRGGGTGCQVRGSCVH